MRRWEKKIKESELRLDDLNKELKEKEQENRISKLKIKEMRRLLKHNQLRPLPGATSANISDGAELRSQASHNSQVQLAPLNKDTLQAHNKKLKEEQEEDKTFVTNGGE